MTIRRLAIMVTLVLGCGDSAETDASVDTGASGDVRADVLADANERDTSTDGPVTDARADTSRPDSDSSVPTVLKAFPTAYGAGSSVTGGRGKPVYVVTNLADSGPGSLRQALEDTKATDGGMVVFAVSGTIVLERRLLAQNLANVTIAGQTAPEGGITIARYGLAFSRCENIIVRYLRVRPTLPAYPASEVDSLYVDYTYRYIIDHVSASFGTDENGDSDGDGTDFTWQRNLFAESNKTGAIIGGSPVDYESNNISFNHNMFYNCSHRFPNWQSDGRVDVINNVVWNWRTRISVPVGPFEVNHINNYYVHYTSSPPPDTDVRGMLWDPQEDDFPTIHSAGNYISDALTDPDADNWFIWRWRFAVRSGPYAGAGQETQLTRDFRQEAPFAQLGDAFEILSAADAFADVRSNVGSDARVDLNGTVHEELDALDARYLGNVRAGTIVQFTPESIFDSDHFRAFVASVSTTPLARHPDGYDTDSDGMPDVWETATFGDLSRNHDGDEDDDGYTNLEEFINLVDG